MKFPRNLYENYCTQDFKNSVIYEMNGYYLQKHVFWTRFESRVSKRIFINYQQIYFDFSLIKENKFLLFILNLVSFVKWS